MEKVQIVRLCGDPEDVCSEPQAEDKIMRITEWIVTDVLPQNVLAFSKLNKYGAKICIDCENRCKHFVYRTADVSFELLFSDRAQRQDLPGPPTGPEEPEAPQDSIRSPQDQADHLPGFEAV